MTNRYFADFHIHIGRALGRPVKMAAAATLTLDRLLHHARCEKGLDIVTVIDGVCTGVQQELSDMLTAGTLMPVSGGGYRSEAGLTVLLGAEVEVGGPRGGAAHFGCWFSTLQAAVDFSAWLATVQTNISLSSQRARCDAATLQREVVDRDGLFIVHHAFTPHKGLYGQCVERLSDMVDPKQVHALELGLSADTDMADCLPELDNLTLLSNSDAHSLPKIAREYNELTLPEPTFQAVRDALLRQHDCRITTNYGLHPALGKYHRTYCRDCASLWPEGATACPCGSKKNVKGVHERWLELREREAPVHPPHRPPYMAQVPLAFIPGLGHKGQHRLLQAFGSEMAVLHDASVAQLASVVGPSLAARIDAARDGRVSLAAGGGGTYGRVQLDAGSH